MTDPVWSPDGAAVVWIERTSALDDVYLDQEPRYNARGDVYAVNFRGWTAGVGARKPPSVTNHYAWLEVGPMEHDQAPVDVLRVVDWVSTDASGLEIGGTVGRGSKLRMSASHVGGLVRAAGLGPLRHGPEPYTSSTSITVGSPEVRPAAPSAGGPPLVVVGGQMGDGLVAEPEYALVPTSAGEVALRREAGDGAGELALTGVLDADPAGDARLSAHGDTVVLGAEGSAVLVRWEDGGWSEPTALPGVVHAVLLPLPAEPAPVEPVPASSGLSPHPG